MHKILLTGGTGFVGKSVLKTFKNYSFLCLSRSKNKNNKNVKWLKEDIGKICKQNIKIISKNLKRGTLRGFHNKLKLYTENKIVSVINGAIYNVTIDLRSSSKTFLKKNYISLSSKNKSSIFIPSGCANAFITLENNTIVHYQMSEIFENVNSKKYKGFRFDDPMFKVRWSFKPKVISKKDKNYKLFSKENFI